MCNPERINLRGDDGHRWAGHLFRAAEPCATIAFLSAMGVPWTYYRPFARALAARGHNVLVSDLRGLGTSSVRASRRDDFGMRELVEIDARVLFEAAREIDPSLPTFLAGHSLGGQIATLASARSDRSLAGLILVACCSPYYRGFSGSTRLSVRAIGAAFPLAARLVGYFPGQTLRFGGREARTVMRDWGRAIRTGTYRLQGTTFDYEAALRRARVPTLAVSFADDHWAPERAVDILLDKLRAADVTHRHLTRNDVGEVVDHFRWARRPNAAVDTIGRWLDARLTRASFTATHPGDIEMHSSAYKKLQG